MSLKYIEFLSPGTLYYKPISQYIAEDSKEIFTVQKLNDNLWNQNKDENWYYCINRKNELPKQGWKIHITATLDEAQKTLDNVTPYLIEKNISFKFVPDYQELLFKNSKNGDRSSSGKFITVYPKNTKEFLNLLVALEKLTMSFCKGPYILNDKQWNGSNVFFRYGGFVPMYTIYKGVTVPAIQTPEGKKIPDFRNPYYELPYFIEEPKMIKEMTRKMDNLFEKEDTSKFDELEVLSALHFSNGGGVYKVKKYDKILVMKEGRPETGLDKLKLDGFNRIRIERDTLKKLSSKSYVVDFYDYFEIWENNYLIEEYLEGLNLQEYIAQNFPFSQKEDKNKYKQKMVKVIEQLYLSLEDLHKNDIALGDLQPNNIIILETGDIKLIDLESATEPQNNYNPGLMTPGYVTKKAKTFEQADWFALLRVARFIFLPIENLSDLSVDIEYKQDEWIKEHFGDYVIQILNSIKSKAESTLQILKKELPLLAPTIGINLDNRKEIIEKFRESLMNNLDNQSYQLVNGDINQYIDKLGALNIANGGYGAIMALHRSGGLPNKVMKWVEDTLEKYLSVDSEYFDNLPKGLFSGLAGISSVLYDIGFKDKGINILESLDLPETYVNEDLTLNSGLAGVGLNYIAFHSIENKQEFLEKAIHIYKIIKNAFIDKIDIVVSDKENLPYGLLNGWSGISLFILYISKYLNEDEKQEAYLLSIEMLDYEINNNINTNTELELSQIEEYSLGYKRLIPYLGEGAAGLALIIIEFQQNNPYFLFENYSKLLNNLSNIVDLYSTYTSGLFRGAGGMIVLSNAQNKLNNEYSSLEYTIKALNNYILFNKSVGLVSPGEYGYRLSMDLKTGVSGLILAFADIDKNSWGSWFPLPENNLLNIFKKI
ncbi:class III lanthionine synthetase LanKC [Staphylococcus xylosus]|uniref:class III lanthionine synthetase LanKC n=1 Tax=Staphylococcus xylosus TaxID=1288 RepID=UPI003F5760FE